MSVSFGKFQDSSDSRQSAKMNLASFKLKTTPFGGNLPKSFIWSDPKFTEVNGKTPAAFRLKWSGTPRSTASCRCLRHLRAAALPPQPCILLCSALLQTAAAPRARLLPAVLHSYFSSCPSNSNASGYIAELL